MFRPWHSNYVQTRSKFEGSDLDVQTTFNRRSLQVESEVHSTFIQRSPNYNVVNTLFGQWFKNIFGLTNIELWKYHISKYYFNISFFLSESYMFLPRFYHRTWLIIFSIFLFRWRFKSMFVENKFYILSKYNKYTFEYYTCRLVTMLFIGLARL